MRYSRAASIPAGRSIRRFPRCFRTVTSSLAVTGVFIAGFSSILTGLNFIVTIHRLRAPGMTWFRFPLFRLVALRDQSIILVLATPVLAMTLLLVSLERLLRRRHFRPSARRRSAAVPASVLVLLASGRLHHDLAWHGRSQRADHLFLAQADLRLQVRCLVSVAIAGIGFLVWGHHMFVSGQSLYAGLVFSFMSFIVAVPSAIKVFNWTATLHKGWIRFDAPMLYALGFIGLFTIGGLTGLFLACARLRRLCHRHLFRRRAFPLHHGRRHGDRLFRRVALSGGQRSPGGFIRNTGRARRRS